MGVIVEYDNEEFFMDPYFALHYIHKDGFLLTFDHLMSLIYERKFNKILPVFSNIQKPVEQNDKTFIMMNPQEIQKSIMFIGRDSAGRSYDEIMMDVFGETNPLMLMQIKIPG